MVILFKSGAFFICRSPAGRRLLFDEANLEEQKDWIPAFVGMTKNLVIMSNLRNEHQIGYSTVTDLARLRGWSTSVPRASAV